MAVVISPEMTIGEGLYIPGEAHRRLELELAELA